MFKLYGPLRCAGLFAAIIFAEAAATFVYWISPPQSRSAPDVPRPQIEPILDMLDAIFFLPLTSSQLADTAFIIHIAHRTIPPFHRSRLPLFPQRCPFPRPLKEACSSMLEDA
ncbi:hypothetical protein OF83DRAFT_1173214 [Amylostereum chailletii]|nr:hypothetical protein OF83DRAFT_1173214 [Amylostereum chailletii]